MVSNPHMAGHVCRRNLPNRFFMKTRFLSRILPAISLGATFVAAIRPATPPANADGQFFKVEFGE